MGRRLFALVLVVLLVGVLAPAAPASARGEDARGWSQPVRAALAQPFAAPRSRFGAGHLGVDFAVAPGTGVRAAGSGVVVFAGSVAGARHVVIAHAGNLRTSYSFLASVSVRRGDDVAVGDVVGTAGGIGEGHDGSVLHLGLRSGDTYIDPMVLFRPLDLSQVVHLAPTSEPPHAQPSSNERRGLLEGLAHSASVALRGAGRTVLRVGRSAARAAEATFPVPAAVLRAGATWAAQHGHCDTHAPAANGEGGSAHQVMLVAGIESSSNGDEPALALSAAALGYEPDEVHAFSYAPGGGNYAPADTEGPILLAAKNLAAQLRERQLREPGHEIDLVGHSLGGVVIETFLALVYEPGDRSYPPLGTVVTLASPLRGDPLASVAAKFARTPAGSAGEDALGAVGRAVGVRLAIGTPAMRDLAAGSRLMQELRRAPWPDAVQLTAIGSATDLIVPGNAATRPDARQFTVVSRALNAHTGILEDPSALRALRAALERKDMPCQSGTDIFVGQALPAAITAVQGFAGKALIALRP